MRTIEHRQEAIDQFLAEYFKQTTAPQVDIGSLGDITQSDEGILQKLSSNEKFQRLWAGNKTDYPNESGEPDDSAADEGFCSILAGFTQDRNQIDRLYRASRMMRPKWNREDYRNLTISNALAFGAKNFKENKEYNEAMAKMEASMNKSEAEAEPDVETSIPGAELKPMVEFDLGELQDTLLRTGIKDLPYKMFLGKKRYIVEGWSHIISSFVKKGKTTLLMHLFNEWLEQILYLSEEDADWVYGGVWGYRAVKHAPIARFAKGHIKVIPCLEHTRQQLYDRIKNGQEPIVIIDTLRNLLKPKDENDNSEMARLINPFIALCKEQHKTLIFVLHNRKAAGLFGEAINGGHAPIGSVDVFMEIRNTSNDEQSKRRLIIGKSRVDVFEPLVYEMDDTGKLVVLGDPSEVKNDDHDRAYMDLLATGPKTTKEVSEALDIDTRTAQRNLKRLWEKRKLIVRDPIEDQKKGFEYSWKLVEVNVYGENYKP